MYKFWYDQVKPKCNERAKLCYVSQGIAKDVEKRFDIQIMNWKDLFQKKKQKNYQLNKEQIMWKNNEKIVVLRAKTYSFLRDDNSENKKEKSTKKV